MRFVDRVDAGRQLVDKLSSLKGESGLLVLGIPRGGVVVAYEVALALGAPLDVALSRKLGAPQNEELAIGALAEDGGRLRWIADEIVTLHVPSIFLAVGGYYQNFDQVSDAEVRELLADLAGTQS